MSVIESEMSRLDSLEVVSFMACGSRFAVEATKVQTLSSIGDAHETISFADLIGLVDQLPFDAAKRRILNINAVTGPIAIIVNEPVILCRLPIKSIYPLPYFISQLHRLKGLLGLALTPEGLTMLIDL